MPVATRCSGAALCEDGPYRLIVGGSRPPRAARMIEKLVVSVPVPATARDAHRH